MRDAVEPTVQKYVDSLQAEAAAWQIAMLRNDALALANNESQNKWIKQQLHAPTVALRRGESVDIPEFLGFLERSFEQAAAVPSV